MEIKRIWLSEEGVHLERQDGATGFEAFEAYPRLRNASHKEREAYQLSPFGIHWYQLDEDLAFEGFFK